MARGGAARRRVQYTKNVGSQGKANPNVQALPRNVQSQNLTALQGVQWPANLPTNKPYPDMPQVSDLKPLLQQYGASGVAIFSGIITSEEYNPDFAWRDGIRIYEQMLRNDGQIAAVRDMVELPIRRATWSVEPFSSDPKDQEVASFIESCLFHDMCYETTEGRKLYQKWDDILRHALMHLWYGFMTFEVNWKVEDGWVKWANWTPLIPRTVWRWWVGEDNELTGIQQWTFKNYSYQFVNIPAEKILLFSHRQEGNNYEGVSALRQAYKDWYYKTQYEKIQAIGIERNAVVPPVVKLPENFTSNDVQVAQMIAQNMRANELMGVTIPNTWDIEFPRNQQRYAANSLEAIQYHDTMIARRMLCQFLDLGSKETGSYALADTQVQTFLSALQTIANYIEDVINSDAIPRLCDYNFDGLEGYPKLKSSRLQADIKVISDALKSVLGQNALLTPYPELQSWFADQLGIPTPPVADNPITQTNPTKPTNPDQPDKQQAQKDDAGTKQVQGAPVDDSGSMGNMLAEMTEQVTLLRESFTAIDAVERGEQHLQLMNPNHNPPGPGGGQFAPKGGGSGGSSGGGRGRSSGSRARGGGSGDGASTRSRSGKSTDDRISRLEARMTRAESAHAAERAAHEETKRQLKAAQHELARVQRENETLRARTEGTKRGAGKSKSETKLTPVRRIRDEREVNPTHPVDVRRLRTAYGEHQLHAVLSRFTAGKLRESAAYHHVPIRSRATKEQIIHELMTHPNAAGTVPSEPIGGEQP